MAATCADANLLGAQFPMVRLPALFGSGMVLQRDLEIVIWGWAAANELVQVDFRGERRNVTADHSGNWRVVLGPYPAGGPYSLTIVGEQSVTLEDILIGDIWLASGQSNMEVPLVPHEAWWRGIPNAEQEIAAADFPQIRLLRVDHTASPKPQANLPAGSRWLHVTRDSVERFSAIAYLFGQELHQRYRVPIGLIQCTWGSLAETWVSARALSQFPEFSADIETLAQVTSASLRKHEIYVQQKARWYEKHRSEDRGMDRERPIWADPAFDDTGWPTVLTPRRLVSCEKFLNGFSGVVWFRRSFNLSPEHVGKDLWLHLNRIELHDSTYVNGHKVGATRGESYPARRYFVPGRHLRRGENSLAIRLVGRNAADGPCVGIFRINDQQVGIEVDETFISLEGEWAYQPGPDLKDFPVTDPVTLAASPGTSTPTALFNGMISPLVMFRIKGVIWYQGESNAIDRRADQYRRLFPALIEDWRRHWEYTLPFLFVQLAGYGRNYPHSAEYEWADLREAQSMALSLPNTGMAVTTDIGEPDDIHPQNKREVARRLALVAANIAYGEKDIVYSGPVYHSFRREEGRVRIRFSNIGSGLLIKDRYGYIRGFEIAGFDGRFQWAHAYQEGSDIVVFNKSVHSPVAVRYNWLNTPDGNVFNREGLPAAPFRICVPVNEAKHSAADTSGSDSNWSDT